MMGLFMDTCVLRQGYGDERVFGMLRQQDFDGTKPEVADRHVRHFRFLKERGRK